MGDASVLAVPRDRVGFGLLLVTVSAVAWSTTGFFTRLIALDSATMAFWRGLFGGLGILLFLAVRDRGAVLASFRRLGWIGWGYALVCASGMICFITALRFTTVAHVAVIYATVPFMAAGLAWLVMRERPSASAALASGVALAGVAVMVGVGAEGGLLGDLLALFMTLTMAVMIVVARRCPAVPMLPAVCVACLLSAVLTSPFAGQLAESGGQLPELALFGLVSSSLGVVFFMLGARLLPAIQAALVSALDTPLGPIWVWLAFGETPATATLIGGGIVFAAVVGHILHTTRG